MMFRLGPLWVRNVPNCLGCWPRKVPPSKGASLCHKRSLVHRSRSMQPSSDCWRSSSLGASSETVSMQLTSRQEHHER